MKTERYGRDPKFLRKFSYFLGVTFLVAKSFDSSLEWTFKGHFFLLKNINFFENVNTSGVFIPALELYWARENMKFLKIVLVTNQLIAPRCLACSLKILSYNRNR